MTRPVLTTVPATCPACERGERWWLRYHLVPTDNPATVLVACRSCGALAEVEAVNVPPTAQGPAEQASWVAS